ncbi:hypothetical protein HWV62_26466 [Athelia sp. TMB]|nr:hypothetical protein HWV62_26466 [Athelia sp. TMB]
MVTSPYAQQLEPLSLKLQEMGAAREMLLAKLADLEAAMRIVQHDYNVIFNSASIMAKIPDEILATIFEQAHSCEDGLELQVSQLTHRWREVALCTPRLWCKVRVSSYKQADLAALYLDRSKGLPFDLTISIKSTDDEALFCGMFLNRIHLCRRLTINLKSDLPKEERDFVDHLVSATLPLLKSFEMSCLYGAPTDIFTGGTPLLTDVRLSKSLHCLPPLHSITTLRLVGVHTYSGPEKWRDMLLSLTSLISLEVVDGIEILNQWESPAVIKLPALQSLCVKAVNARNNQSVFRCLYDTIDAPLLECLSLESFIDEDLVFLKESWPLGATKFPALRTLTLSDFETHEPLCPFMRTFPNVQTVMVKGRSGSTMQRLLQLLQYSETAQTHWPVLRCLGLPDLWLLDERIPPGLLPDCIASRMRLDQPIETLVLAADVVDDALMGMPANDVLSWFHSVRLVKYDEEGV